jgi:hypothetical protein
MEIIANVIGKYQPKTKEKKETTKIEIGITYKF